jgi:hypothetical protein
MGKDYAMVLDLKTGGEAWRVDFMGRRKGVGTVFPSTLSHVGGMSTQQMGVTSADAKLYATYADYDSADPSRENSGHRYLVALDCQ